ncbi:DUF4347 domain-containing protein, partial [Niveispirillum irakense]|uniref:DUF4347 domain-containing protein n=1 Tax=Niveispirillum irakense TaxID=34011 RepID=UPI00049008B9
MAGKRITKGVDAGKVSTTTRSARSSLLAMALEPRFMFDAAGVATAADPGAMVQPDIHSDAHEASTADAHAIKDAVPPAADAPKATTAALTEKAATPTPADAGQNSVRTVVFVDTTVNDYETLIKDIAPDAKVVLLDPNREAFSQMAEALSGMSDLDAVHVVSHGNEGHLYIAGRAYWADGLANRGQDLQAIGAALRPGGDILFYACNVGSGEVGQAFAQTIHRLTGADVAVSSDQTGNAAEQNWTLEVQTGAIEAATPFALASMEAFSGKLATVTVTSASGNAAGSLNHAIVNAGDGDIIVFDPTLASGTISLGVTTTILTAAAQNFTINGDVNGDGIADITISGDNGDNTSSSADYRGILFNAAGKTLTVKNVIMERFYSASALQGALTLQNGSLEVDGVTFRNNLNNPLATTTAATSLTIRNSVFRENVGVVTGTAGFAVIRSQVTGTLTIENTLVVDNNYVMNMGSPSAQFPGSTIVQNNAAAYTVNIRNVTIANNSYINNDAGAASVKTAGIGLYSGGSSTLNIYNTIIAGNSGNLAGTSFADPNAIIYNAANFTFNGSNNYQGDITGNAVFVDSTNATLSLRDYRPTSTATTFINQGNSSNASYYGGSYDIRGIDRIRDGALDLGAYEVHWNAGEPTVDLNGAGTGNNEAVNSGTPSSGVLIAPNANLAQTDTDTRLLGATVSLSGISDTGNETLTLSAAEVNTAKTYGIAVRSNDGATITLTGAASLADYQSVIRLIQYKNSASSFTAGDRTATITVNDGETTSTARTSTITLGTVVDTTPPSVSSIALSGTPGANATSVSYTVTFSESVTGVNSSDFTLASTGTATGTISDVTGSGSTYTVTVSSISGTGTLGLNLNSSGTGIQDAASNAITAGFTGTTRTVDRDAPVFTSSATVSAAENQSAVVTLAATEPVSYSIIGGADQAKFSLIGSALSFASSPDFEAPTDTDSNNVYVVTVRATDANGNTTAQTISVTVTNVNEAPVSSVNPAISGTAQVGNSLTASSGTWSDPENNTLSYSYQWYRADDNSGTNLVAISGATAATYALSTSDAHKFLRVVVTANDGNGGTQTATSAYTAITNSAPAASAVPTVTGSFSPGSNLSTSTGTWADADGDTLTYTYQWYRADNSTGTGEVAISGATSSTYSVVVGDLGKYLRVVVTANDSNGGTQTAASTRSQVTSNGAPVNSVVPSITGTATVGNALSTGTGTWSDPDGDTLSYTYQWYRADDNAGTNLALISGATNANYTLTTSDAHKYLRVVVTASDGNGGTQTATSAYTAITNSAPVNSVVPSISGTATVGNALSTTNGTWTDADGDGRSFTYQWYRADDNAGTNLALISGATSANYTLTTSDAHKYLRVVVTASDGKGGT